MRTTKLGTRAKILHCKNRDHIGKIGMITRELPGGAFHIENKVTKLSCATKDIERYTA